ncbi:unnamed protein product [Meloidogyne enterolobii]|uniref:Uncharacterized protein n=1 Tax=Meloidogyne enterolobii TaxID=390850 RepID=A0ACB0ZM91_MELEN
MTLLQEPVVDFYLCGEMEHFYKFQLKHLPYYGSRYCLEATVPPYNELSERKGFEINFFHESTEFDENIGDTVLRMNFVFDIKNASNDLLFLDSYQHSKNSWDELEIHPNPIGRSGVTFDIRIYATSVQFQISINNGIDLINYRYRLPPWATNYITVSGDIKGVLFGNKSSRCKAYYEKEKNTEKAEIPFPTDIYQVDTNNPLKNGDLISIQGIVKLPKKFDENAVNICISFYHEALEWHPSVGQTVFQANFSVNYVTFNTYMEGWKFNKTEEPIYKLRSPLAIGQLFDLEIFINQKEFKIHYGIMQKMNYTQQLPSWTIQYIKVDSEALSLPPRGHYVKIERMMED